MKNQENKTAGNLFVLFVYAFSFLFFMAQNMKSENRSLRSAKVIVSANNHVVEKFASIQSERYCESNSDDKDSFFDKVAEESKSASDFSAELGRAIEEENEVLFLYRNPETRASVEWFFIGVSGDRQIALAILDACDMYKVNPFIAFSIAYNESRFKARAKNVNANGTVDRGVFQLNSRTFRNLSERDFFNPSVSAMNGVKHFAYCLRYAATEERAIANYNAGIAKAKVRIPESTREYISKVESYKSKLQNDFYDNVVDYYL